MFYYVKGELVMTDPQSAVVDCGGVGYKLTVSMNTLSHLTEIGKTVCLYTHFSVREDAVELFGFYDTEELSASGRRRRWRYFRSFRRRNLPLS